MFGQPSWQRIADDILLDSAVTIRRINWWGFYNLDNPPVTETMRIRFYGAREVDGLPDDSNIVFEESFLNPSRIATGRTVFTGVDPDEYIYQVNLTPPIQLDAATPYWLEIVQIGDVDTAFRWEVSQAEQNGQAFINEATVDWRSTLPSLTADTAFQLIIPEPSVFGLCICGFLFLRRRGVTERRR